MTNSRYSWDAIVLNDKDQIATALRAIKSGESIVIKAATGDLELTVQQDIPLCHKFAISDIGAGDEIRKYGEVIGAASDKIGAGEHVHIHNLISLRAQADN